MGFNLVAAEAAIIAVMIGDNEKTFKFWKALYEEGVFVNAFISPAVRDGQQMLRLSFMASHQDSHLEFILHAFKKIGTRLGIISDEPIHMPVLEGVDRELVA